MQKLTLESLPLELIMLVVGLCEDPETGTNPAAMVSKRLRVAVAKSRSVLVMRRGSPIAWFTPNNIKRVHIYSKDYMDDAWPVLGKLLEYMERLEELRFTNVKISSAVWPCALTPIRKLVLRGCSWEDSCQLKLLNLKDVQVDGGLQVSCLYDVLTDTPLETIQLVDKSTSPQTGALAVLGKATVRRATLKVWSFVGERGRVVGPNVERLHIQTRTGNVGYRSALSLGEFLKHGNVGDLTLKMGTVDRVNHVLTAHNPLGFVSVRRLHIHERSFDILQHFPALEVLEFDMDKGPTHWTNFGERYAEAFAACTRVTTLVVNVWVNNGIEIDVSMRVLQGMDGVRPTIHLKYIATYDTVRDQDNQNFVEKSRFRDEDSDVIERVARHYKTLWEKADTVTISKVLFHTALLTQVLNAMGDKLKVR